jgi:hypothetical protein
MHLLLCLKLADQGVVRSSCVAAGAGGELEAEGFGGLGEASK